MGTNPRKGTLFWVIERVGLFCLTTLSKERVTRNAALPPHSLLRHAPQEQLKQLRPHPE